MGTIKKPLVILICVAVSICLEACALLPDLQFTDEKDSSENTYQIYYLDRDGCELVRRDYEPEGTTFNDILNEVLEAFRTPNTNDVISALPDNVEIQSTSILINEISVDFSADYLSMDTITELMLRSALVETLVQLPEVYGITFTIDSQSLVIGGVEVGLMTGNTFIVPVNETINSYRNIQLPLYFSNADGTGLILEMRTVYYSSNLVTERLVAEQIIDGPSSDSYLAVTKQNVLVRSTSIDDGVCTIDFSDDVNDLPYSSSPVLPQTALYAFVDAICDACEDEGVSSVRLMINGSSDTRFRGQINLDQEFTRDADIIDKT